ncbi:MAG: NAD(P)-dependent oxidoreductase, partial [Acidimicrobiales bacterium]
AEAVVTMVATPDALDEVLFGPAGAADQLSAGAALIDMSTVGPAAVAAVSTRLPEGVAMLDVPVLGSVSAAADGTLKLFAGGNAADVERWRPVLERLGPVRHVGPLGSGAAMKLVANATLGTLMTGLGEALALADALGLDQASTLEVLSDSPIGVTAKGKRSRLESGRYPPNFKLELAVKDLVLVTEAARTRGLDVPLAGAARSWFEAAGQAGLGPLDYSAVIAHIRGQEARLPD